MHGTTSVVFFLRNIICLGKKKSEQMFKEIRDVINY